MNCELRKENEELRNKIYVLEVLISDSDDSTTLPVAGATPAPAPVASATPAPAPVAGTGEYDSDETVGYESDVEGDVVPPIATRIYKEKILDYRVWREREIFLSDSKHLLLFQDRKQRLSDSSCLLSLLQDEILDKILFRSMSLKDHTFANGRRFGQTHGVLFLGEFLDCEIAALSSLVPHHQHSSHCSSITDYLLAAITIDNQKKICQKFNFSSLSDHRTQLLNSVIRYISNLKHYMFRELSRSEQLRQNQIQAICVFHGLVSIEESRNILLRDNPCFGPGNGLPCPHDDESRAHTEFSHSSKFEKNQNFISFWKCEHPLQTTNAFKYFNDLKSVFLQCGACHHHMTDAERGQKRWKKNAQKTNAYVSGKNKDVLYMVDRDDGKGGMYTALQFGTKVQQHRVLLTSNSEMKNHPKYELMKTFWDGIYKHVYKKAPPPTPIKGH
jgi:hypothetical protein